MDVRFSCDYTSALFVVASFGSAPVSVGVLQLLRVSFEVLEGVHLESSVAAATLWVAVDELLFGELEEVACLDCVVAFHGGGRRESPA